VSNEIDDNETHAGMNGQLSGAADNSIDDRTHMALPGGTVQASLQIADHVFETSATVPLDGTVYLEMVVPVVANSPIISSSQVALHTHIMRETFAQVGLKTHAYITFLDIDPEGDINLDDGLIILAPNSTGTNFVHEETRNLISEGGTVSDTTDIHVFYTKEMFPNPIQGRCAGMQIRPGNNIASSHMKYTYNAFISTWDSESEDIFLPFCPAHELVHLLSDDGSDRENMTWNLMGLGTACFAADDISNPKRLDEVQEAAIKTDTIHITE